MAKRKLKVESWSQDDALIQLYFSRPLSPLEAEGIIHLLKERLEKDA